jgi:hypothetical protein
MRRLTRTLVIVAVAGAAALVPGSALAAPEASTARGSWIGPCSGTKSLASVWGWCDGNGPTWTYRSFVECSDVVPYGGPERWAGDRRGSSVGCPSGTWAVRGGIQTILAGIPQRKHYL